MQNLNDLKIVVDYGDVNPSLQDFGTTLGSFQSLTWIFMCCCGPLYLLARKL
jgi:hypothetical protein